MRLRVGVLRCGSGVKPFPPCGIHHIVQAVHVIHIICIDIWLLPGCAVPSAIYAVKNLLGRDLPAAEDTADRCAHAKFLRRRNRIEDGIAVGKRKVGIARAVHQILEIAFDNALDNFFLALVDHAIDPLAQSIPAAPDALR